MIDTIVDVNHNDEIHSSDWPKLINHVVALIHKATQGLTFIDPQYATRRLTAGANGLLWGAYHFAVYADGAAQADAFLATAKPDKDTFIALDLEHNPNGRTITLSQAEDFVARVFSVTGRYPFVYGSDLLADFAVAAKPDSVLFRCKLWIARYSSHWPVVPGGWKNWTLWQYTAGETASPEDSLPGLGHVDRSRFNGTLEELKATWST